MTLKCDYCSKGSMRGNTVSHAKNRAKRVFRPNLHKVNLKIEGEKAKLMLCTRCLRTLKKKQLASE